MWIKSLQLNIWTQTAPISNRCMGYILVPHVGA
jgi:hypothetical protein